MEVVVEIVVVKRCEEECQCHAHLKEHPQAEVHHLLSLANENPAPLLGILPLLMRVEDGERARVFDRLAGPARGTLPQVVGPAYAQRGSPRQAGGAGARLGCSG